MIRFEGHTTMMDITQKHESDYDTEYSETELLTQTERVIDLRGGFMSREDLSRRQLLALLDYLDTHAARYAHIHELAMIAVLYNIVRDLETAEVEKNVLLEQQKNIRTQVDVIQAHPKVWVHSTPLYRALLEDLYTKHFQSSF